MTLKCFMTSFSQLQLLRKRTIEFHNLRKYGEIYMIFKHTLEGFVYRDSDVFIPPKRKHLKEQHGNKR